MLIYSRLDNSPIDIKIFPNSLNAVMISSGLDSAILFYLLLMNSKNQNIKYQPFSIDKADGAMLHVENVLDYLRNKTDMEIPRTIIVGDPSLYHALQSRSAIEEIFEKYPEHSYVYAGTNQNPPEPYKMPGLYPNRVQTEGKRLKMPFLHLYKTHILDLMFEYGIDELAKITHSCTEQKVGRCNKCFQCHERAWAFQQLDKKDEGIV